MVITLDRNLETVLEEQAKRDGIAPEELVLTVLREHLLAAVPQPRDEWERDLLEAARPWGISLPNTALSSDGLND